jgi:hypothetical protein
MESESLRDRLVRSKASRTGLLSPVFPAPLFRCDLNQTRIPPYTSFIASLAVPFSTRCTTCRTTEHLQSRRVRRSNAKTRTLLYTALIGSVALLAAGDHPAKAPFEGLYDWWTSEGGAGGGGLFEMPPPAKGTSKGPPNPTVSIWEGRSGAHRPRSGGMQGRNTSSQTLARVEPPKQNRRRPRLRPPAKGTTSTAPRPG